MPIKRLNYTNSSADEKYINIDKKEIIKIHDELVLSYKNYLEPYNVKPLWSKENEKITEIDIPKLNVSELQLIFLYKYKGCFVHKDLISAFVRKNKPSAGLDQQVRHLSSQHYWNVLNKGNKVPDESEFVPNGYHYLVSIETPAPKLIAIAMKRTGRLAAQNWDQLKLVYGNSCATCGAKEGVKDWRTSKIVKLQQGHMDPREKLTLDNTIPQCEYCNQTYKDYFRFDEYGRVIAVNNPEVLLKSPVDIQDEMIKALLDAKEKR